MKAIRFGTVQKVSTIVPLALVSAAWTAGLTGVGGATVAADSELPHGGTVPTEALEDPANFTIPGQLGLGVPRGKAGDVINAASTNGIPSAALAAYQRAETVINAADKACNIEWQLIAAIGRVESDHGRYGGNVLSTDGISRPGIYGIPLDGTNKTQAISDTDAGQYDRDKVWDRAVGPMQFIPSTWSVVGVDADGDGQRNPQDVDDAALASAVYLCSGTDDLGTEAGRRAAVFRYNHSQEYVDLVLAVRDAYLEGDYTAVPNYTASAITFTPDYSYTPPKYNSGTKSTTKKPGGTKAGTKTNTGTKSGTNTGGGGGGGDNDGDGDTPIIDDTDDGDGILDNGGGDGLLDNGGGDGGTLTDKVESTVKDPVGTIEDTTKETTTTITKAAASTICSGEAATKDLTTPLVKDYDKFYAECMDRYGF
jgi:hypothetical protein